MSTEALTAIWQDPALDEDGKVHLTGLALAMYDGRDDYPAGDLDASQRWVSDNGYADRAREALAAWRG